MRCALNSKVACYHSSSFSNCATSSWHLLSLWYSKSPVKTKSISIANRREASWSTWSTIRRKSQKMAQLSFNDASNCMGTSKSFLCLSGWTTPFKCWKTSCSREWEPSRTSLGSYHMHHATWVCWPDLTIAEMTHHQHRSVSLNCSH
jgi:hypothetical protein